MTTRDAEVAILATERILERTEEVAPSILLGKTLRIGKAILSENIQEDLVHEAATLGNYMAMVQKDLEELKKKVKVQFTPAAEFKDPKYMAGMDLVQQVDMRHNPHLIFFCPLTLACIKSKSTCLVFGFAYYRAGKFSPLRFRFHARLFSSVIVQ